MTFREPPFGRLSLVAWGGGYEGSVFSATYTAGKAIKIDTADGLVLTCSGSGYYETVFRFNDTEGLGDLGWRTARYVGQTSIASFDIDDTIVDTAYGSVNWGPASFTKMTVGDCGTGDALAMAANYFQFLTIYQLSVYSTSDLGFTSGETATITL